MFPTERMPNDLKNSALYSGQYSGYLLRIRSISQKFHFSFFIWTGGDAKDWNASFGFSLQSYVVLCLFNCLYITPAHHFLKYEI